MSSVLSKIKKRHSEGRLFHLLKSRIMPKLQGFKYIFYESISLANIKLRRQVNLILRDNDALAAVQTTQRLLVFFHGYLELLIDRLRRGLVAQRRTTADIDQVLNNLLTQLMIALQRRLRYQKIQLAVTAHLFDKTRQALANA